MKAIVQDTYGPAEVLQMRDIDQPLPAADEALVRMHAAGVDPSVWHLMTGLPYLLRFTGFGLRAPKAQVPHDLGGPDVRTSGSGRDPRADCIVSGTVRIGWISSVPSAPTTGAQALVRSGV